MTKAGVVEETVEAAEQLVAMDAARAAFVAGLVHATLAQGGWTVLECEPSAGRVRVGCAALFGAGTVADVVVVVRKVDEL
jgi:hypothetical protein